MKQKWQLALSSWQVDLGILTAGIVWELGAAHHFPKHYFVWRAAEQLVPHFQPFQKQWTQMLSTTASWQRWGWEDGKEQ